MPIGKYRRPSAVARFWKKVHKIDGGCWVWTGFRNKEGYGLFVPYTKISMKRLRAHRLSLRLAGISVPKDKIVMHLCDNPSCVRPDHLRVGTHADNFRDAVEKGRVPPNPPPRAKLTLKQVSEILVATGSFSKIAKRYGVSKGCIQHIRQRHTWVSAHDGGVKVEVKP